MPITQKILSLSDLEAAAMPYTEKAPRDYWETGSNDLLTLAENQKAFDYLKIRARAMRGVGTIDISPKVELFGKKFRAPIGVAPSAYHQMADDSGECGTAAACQARNWPMGLSSYSNKPLEEVRQAGPDAALFFQLYVFKNKKTSENLVKKAERAGFKAIALTVDTPYLGNRYADVRNNFKLPSHLSARNFEGTTDLPIDNAAEADSWARKIFNGEECPPDANVVDPDINWAETIPWLRSITNMQIWVKGIVTAEDTHAAIEAGVDGIWVSNHGGRQLDSGLATIDALPEVVEAAAGRIPVHIDGGIRRGGDVFKCLALGADFVWLGRPAIWGLKYDGQAGVELMEQIIEDDLKLTMALAGTKTVAEINRSCLVRIGPAITKL